MLSRSWFLGVGIVACLLLTGSPELQAQSVPPTGVPSPVQPPTRGKPNPALHEAVERGQLARVKAILDADPKMIEARDADGWTPLAHAARFGQVAMVKFLLERGAEVNARDKAGYTPLHQAAAYGLQEVAEALLDAGAEVNALTTGRVTPRRLAISNGYPKVQELLEDHGGH